MSIFKRFEKEKWKLVKIISENFKLNTHDGEIDITFYYNLLQSNKDNRQVEFSSTYKKKVDLAYIANQRTIYHEKIRRWELGRKDPDIPQYDEIDEEDTANYLKGKV
jgi:RecA-family ATPase